MVERLDQPADGTGRRVFRAKEVMTITQHAEVVRIEIGVRVVRGIVGLIWRGGSQWLVAGRALGQRAFELQAPRRGIAYDDGIVVTPGRRVC